MKIELWSDFACPFCYLGKKRFEKALTNFAHANEVEIVYKAYQLNPHAPLVMQGRAAESFAHDHNMSVAEVEERFKMFTNAALEEGLVYRYDIMQMTKTFDAHRLAKWARKFNLEAQLTDRLMKAYFTDGLNIADHETLSFIAKGIGLDSEVALAVLKSRQYANQVLEEIAEARSIGVQGVPFFVLNRKYGISGAQQKEYFTGALEQIWTEENPVKILDNQDDSMTCDHDECGIE